MASTEQSLRQSTAERGENAPELIIFIDEQRRIVAADDAVSALLGYTQEDLAGWPVERVLQINWVQLEQVRLLQQPGDQELSFVAAQAIDQVTMETTAYYAKIIFLNASAIGSTHILMNSKSKRYENGMDDSGSLGGYLMDHHFQVGAGGSYEGFEDSYYIGRRPNGIYIPRFRNFTEKGNDYLRGFGYQGGAGREGWGRGNGQDGFGAEFKDQLSYPGKWNFSIMGFGECLPYENNRVYLSKDQKDKWGLPLIVADAAFQKNELNMRKDMMNDAAEMLEAAGLKNVYTYDSGANLGLGIHEMGTARMGKDPKTSVLNEWNQVHGAKNVFCTDGACMTSSSCVNPSLTYMALTARAADYAVKELKKGNL